MKTEGERAPIGVSGDHWGACPIPLPIQFPSRIGIFCFVGVCACWVVAGASRTSPLLLNMAKSCKEYRERLVECYKNTECIRAGKTMGECLRSKGDDVPDECRKMLAAYSQCKRNQVRDAMCRQDGDWTMPHRLTLWSVAGGINL